MPRPLSRWILAGLWVGVTAMGIRVIFGAETISLRLIQNLTLLPATALLIGFWARHRWKERRRGGRG